MLPPGESSLPHTHPPLQNKAPNKPFKLSFPPPSYLQSFVLLISSSSLKLCAYSMRAGAHRPSGVLHAAVLALSATVPLNRAQQQEPPCSSCSTSSSSGVGRIFSAGYHGRNPQIHPNALVLWGKTLSEPDAQRVQSSFKVIKMKKKKKSL